MPFVQRVVKPKYLSRVSLHDDEGKPKIKDGELEAVTNFTLSSALRQLASVVLIANEIFEGLSKELEDVTERSTKLRTKINAVEEKIKNFDPRSVTVPEGDLTHFASRSQNFSSSHPITRALFTADTRPQSVRNLYESAGPTPVAVMRLMDRYRRDGIRSSKFFSVTPVLGASRRKPRTDDIDIETRTPAVVVHLRRWTSIEAMGDVTAELDCTHKVAVPEDDVDHRLPSPEEQLQAVALKFPAEVVPVDVSGRTFNRMSSFRRSLLHVEYEESRRRGGGSKTRRTRGKRRNTIAGTDSKELAAIVGDSSDTNFGKSTPDTELSPSAGEKKSHLESLKEWGRSRLRLIRNIEPAVKLRERSASRRKLDKEEPTPHSSSGNWSASSESGQSTATSHHPRSSVSSGSTCQKHSRRPVMVSTSSSVTSESTLTPDDGETCSMYSCDTEGYYTSFHLDSGLKTLREEDPLPPLQSCSALSGSRGNNSTLTADSEYELFGKGSTSTTASSAGTVCTTLLIPPAPNVPERVSSQLTSSNKETSAQDRNVTVLNNLSSSRKDATSNKVDKKASNKVDHKQKSSHEQKSNLTKENVLKLKSVDETCSTNMITVEVHHGGEGVISTPEKCGDSPDSGHNTCSSPVDSIASPSIDLEMSECSDLEGVDRMERIRVKTTINSSRIPSMCVITPPQSDDEVSLNALRGPVDIGDYVTIADVRSPPVLKREIVIKETEYVSLNELPPNESSLERKRKGARVTLDSEGKVVYSSDSLRRRKSVHTTGTFEPGPNVAASNNASPILQHRISSNIRPVVSSGSPVMSDRLSPSATNPTVVPKTTLRQTNGSRSQVPLVSNGVQSSQSHTNDTATSNFNKECNKSTIAESTNQRNNLSLTRSTATQQYFPRSSYNKLSPKITGRPMSPLAASQQMKQGMTQSKKDSPRQIPPSVFPNLKSLSPKMVVRAKQTARAVSSSSQRGAYVKVSDSPGSPEDDCKYLVKRSDSYRMANDDNKIINPNLHGRKQYGPAIVAGPSLLSAIQNSRNSKDQVDTGRQAMGSQQQTPKQHARVPSDQINPPRQFGLCSSTPTKSSRNNVLDFTTNLSPISHQRSSTPVPKSRTAMDLYAIIHESKKKISKLKEQNRLPVKSEGSSPTHPSPPRSSPTRSSPKQVSTEGPLNWPKAIPTSHVPNFVHSAMYGQAPVSVNPDRQYQLLRKSPLPSDDYRQSSDYRYGSLPYLRSESTRNSPTHMFASPSRNSSSLDRRKYLLPSPDRPSLASDRHGRAPATTTTSRNDFKQLLLRTNFGSNSVSKSSAVERLKNKVPLSPKKSSSWKSDVLSSTIPEVCSEEDEQIQTPTQTIPVSSALVNQQNKAFARYSPTLETAL